MIKDIEYFIKKTFFSKNFLLKRRLEREINKNYEKELSIIHNYEDKNKAAIDVGVYRGVYSYKLSKHFKKVFSFEPNPLIYENLNSTLTKITDNIEIFNYALSNTEGITKLKIPNRGNSLFDKNYEELFKLGAATIHEENDIIDYESFDVKKTLLDKIIPSSEKIGFIKIDVEGHEEIVINELTKCSFIENVSHIFCEIDTNWLDVDRLKKKLASVGFSSFEKVGTGEIHYDMLISRN